MRRRELLKGWNSPIMVAVFLVVYLLEYLVFCAVPGGYGRFPFAIDIAVFLIVSITYFQKYRRDNVLCFELFFLPVFFVGMFFYDIIDITFAGNGVGGALLNAITDEFYVGKSRVLQMVAFLAFMLGCSIANNGRTEVENTQWKNLYINGNNVDFNVINIVLALFILIQIWIDYRAGMFDTYFVYSQDVSNEDKNTGYATLRSLCFILTIFEFTRLSQKGVHSLKSFWVHCNKLYVFEVLGISTVLLISGNRNEMLLIFLPMVVAYSLLIKKLSSKFILAGVVAGAIVFALSGLTRHGESDSLDNMSVYGVVQDYSLVTVDCNFLIKYTDEKEPLYFKEFPLYVLSGIPFMGHRIIDMLHLSYEAQSTRITTQNMAMNDTGLGTSLIGDLYYNGKWIFVVAYMWFFGWMISKLHNRFTIDKKYNVYLLIIYLYMVSDGVYYIREQWDFPLKSILYSMIVVFVLGTLFQKRKLA